MSRRRRKRAVARKMPMFGFAMNQTAIQLSDVVSASTPGVMTRELLFYTSPAIGYYYTYQSLWICCGLISTACHRSSTRGFDNAFDPRKSITDVRPDWSA